MNVSARPVDWGARLDKGHAVTVLQRDEDNPEELRELYRTRVKRRTRHRIELEDGTRWGLDGQVRSKAGDTTDRYKLVPCLEPLPVPPERRDLWLEIPSGQCADQFEGEPSPLCAFCVHDCYETCPRVAEGGYPSEVEWRWECEYYKQLPGVTDAVGLRAMPVRRRTKVQS